MGWIGGLLFYHIAPLSQIEGNFSNVVLFYLKKEKIVTKLRLNETIKVLLLRFEESNLVSYKNNYTFLKKMTKV